MHSLLVHIMSGEATLLLTVSLATCLNSLADYNTWPNSHLYDRKISASAIECVTLCARMKKCVGCQFQMSTHLCQITSPKDDTAKSQTKTEIPFVSDTGKEIPLCGEAPDFPNSQKTTKGHSKGDVTTYTCKPGFFLCPTEASHSVCQSSGQWEKANVMCEQNWWMSAVTVGLVGKFPCGILIEFTAKMLLFPTKKTKFTVEMKSKLDSPLLIEFRVSKSNVIVINSFIRRKFQRESRLYTPIKPRKTIVLLIRSRRGGYNIKVNGIKKRYKCPERNLHPDGFIVSGEVRIDSAEIIPEKFL